MIVKLIMLFVFFGIMILVGIHSRKHTKNISDFVLGGRSVGPWLTAFAFGTSYFSSVVFIGYAGRFGWDFGVSATWIGLGNALIGSLFAWIILGRRTRVMTKHFNSQTMPEFFGSRYESKSIKITASVIAFVFLVPYTSSIYNGLSRLFGMAFDIPYEICVIVMATLTGVYVILGGYMATAINDLIQGIIMLFGIVAIIVAVLNQKGGFLEAINQLSQINSEASVTLGQPGAYTSFFGPDPLNLISVIILTSLGTWGLPQMVHKFYTIKDEKAIKTGTIISTLFAIVVSGGCYFLGAFSRLFDNGSIRNAEGKVIFDSIVPYMISFLPDILVGITVVLVLSASMSTLSALVLTSSSTLTLDFLKETCFKKMKTKTQLLLMRILIAFFILISVVLALDPPKFIAELMGISWSALAGSFLAPFLYGLYWKGVTKAGVWSAFLVGVGVTVVNLKLEFFSSSIVAGAFTMLLSLIVVPIVSIVTPKLSKTSLLDMFSCYQETVIVSKKDSLEE
ncbi:sodium/proline symporter [Lachnoclostridium phytofermentans]|uniref:sodium/proline symporter n=1 Tax=Lachnoclostridium phytofermentans TaxID=66219 RepID=UPI0004962C54|nr:sodium/proline symporter [Lachnoclostridium phytofermentans]